MHLLSEERAEEKLKPAAPPVVPKITTKLGLPRASSNEPTTSDSRPASRPPSATTRPPSVIALPSSEPSSAEKQPLPSSAVPLKTPGKRKKSLEPLRTAFPVDTKPPRSETPKLSSLLVKKDESQVSPLTDEIDELEHGNTEKEARV